MRYSFSLFLMLFCLCLELNSAIYRIYRLTGVFFEVETAEEGTIMDLKENIFNLKNIPINEQRIVFQGRDLEDQENLADTIAKHQSPIYLVLRLKGGGKIFKDITQASTSLIDRGFAEPGEAPPWRHVYPGLNLLGPCQNKNCEAYLAEVVCPIGFASYDENTETKCPKCNKIFASNDCIYYLCRFKFKTIKSNGEKHKSKWFKAKNKRSCKGLPESVGYESFDKLKIFCRELD